MLTVLVVEDDGDILSAVSEALIEEGWEVVGAPSAEEAVSVVRSRAIDVVLCDVLLAPGVDGPTLRDRFLRHGLGHLPFVFATASTREANRLREEVVLRKPFAVSELVGLLNAALAGAAASSAAL